MVKCECESTLVEYPQYRCRKVVRAFKIDDIWRSGDGSAVLKLVGRGWLEIVVTPEYMKKHDPQIGGYCIIHQPGYPSYRPAGVFEADYERI